MYEPLKATVTNESRMIVPPVVPRSVDIRPWEPGAMLEYGEIRRSSAGSLYWCVVGGHCGVVEPSHVYGDAASDMATLRYLKPKRKYLALVNDGAAVIYIGGAPGAEVNKGTRLNPSGGSVTYAGDQCPQGAVYALAAIAGTYGVSIQEAP